MDKYVEKRALLLKKYWDWVWHFRLDGTMWIKNKRTKQTIEVGKIEP